MKYCIISFITFQAIVATIKEKEYNFLDQRKMDFEQDYEEFCKQTNDLHVGCITTFLLTVTCFFFQLEVGVQVDLGGIDADVSEPERDHGGIDPSVQESHGAGVP